MWRTLTGKHDCIEYMMQIPGHARCLVDSGFAHIKKLYRRSDVDSMGLPEVVVNQSSAVNQAVRYPALQWRDWKTFLAKLFRPIPGVRKCQYFRFSSSTPGVVVARCAVGQTEESFNLLRCAPTIVPTDAPHALPVSGLSRQRQLYLYKNIRQFVRPAYKDVTCPCPDN